MNNYFQNNTELQSNATIKGVLTLKSLNDTTYGGNWRIYNSNSDNNYSDLYFSSINGALVTMNDVFSAGASSFTG